MPLLWLSRMFRMSIQGSLHEPLISSANTAQNWRRICQEFEIYLLSSEKDEKDDEVKIALLLNSGGRELLNIYHILPVE